MLVNPYRVERLREILEVKLDFPCVHEKTNLLLSQKELFRLTSTKINANYYTKLSLDQLLCDENFSTVTIVFEDSWILFGKKNDDSLPVRPNVVKL